MDNTDPIVELDALRVIAQALHPLDQDSRRRVLNWASEKFLTSGIRSAAQPQIVSSSTNIESPTSTTNTKPPAPWSLEGYDSIGNLYHACTPSSDGEKALVISAWLQKTTESDGIDSYSVNSELKNLGYGIGNITRAFDYLIQAKPALMIQVRKSGTSKQARKSFRVTDAGLKRIRDMIAQNQASKA